MTVRLIENLQIGKNFLEFFWLERLSQGFLQHKFWSHIFCMIRRERKKLDIIMILLIFATFSFKIWGLHLWLLNL